MLASLLLAVPISAAALPVAQDPVEEFRSQFRSALELNDKKAMDGLLRKQKTIAITEFISNADSLASGGTELGGWIEAFGESWQRVYRSAFARNYYRYLERMSGTTRKNRGEILRSYYPQLLQMHAEALTHKTEKYWIPVREDAEKVVEAMRQTGDLYYLSVLLYCQGNAYNSDLTDGDGSDDQRALEIYEEYLRAREQLALTNDADYDTVKNLAAETRAKLGIPDPSTGEVGERKVSRFVIQPLEGAEPVEAALDFAAEVKPLAVQHANDLADDHRLSWKLVGTHEVGTEGAFHGFDPPVVVRRTDFNKFVIDGGAGPSEEFKLSTKPVVVEYQRKLEGGQTVDHAMMVAGGIDRDMFHGSELNLSIGKTHSTVFYRSVGTMVGDTPYGKITLYDHDGDGRYGYPELVLAGAFGLPKETWLYRYDSVLLGKGKHSQPFSRFITDGKGAWFELKLEDHALLNKVELTPMAPKLGTLKVTMKGLKGLKLTSLVLMADTSQIRGTMIDLMLNKNGSLQVPIGRYKVQQGLARGPKGAEAVILPAAGRSMIIDLEEGKTETIELGTPFTLSVDRRLEGNKLVFEGQSLCVTGKAGERYLRLVGAPLFGTEVELKGEKAEGELRGSTAEEMMAQWPLVYLPQDLELELKKAEMPPVRLTMKKHPWFGKLDTGWLE